MTTHNHTPRTALRLQLARAEARLDALYTDIGQAYVAMYDHLADPGIQPWLRHHDRVRALYAQVVEHRTAVAKIEAQMEKRSE